MNVSQPKMSSQANIAKGPKLKNLPKNEQDHTSLYLASEGGHPETVRLLLQHGADVDTQDLTHCTPFFKIHLYTRAYSKGI